MEPFLVYSVEDDEGISLIINKTLTKKGYEVVSFVDGESFLLSFEKQKPDLVLLDLMLPGIQGTEVLRRIRAKRENDEVRVIVISARSLTSDKVSHLEMGADDYLPKPFELTELVSRVAAHCRRIKNHKNKDRLSYGPFAIDLGEGEGYFEGKSISLTPSEYLILKALIEAEGTLLDRETLWKTFSGNVPYDPKSKSLDMHIKSLRHKSKEDAIVSIYGRGYRISL